MSSLNEFPDLTNFNILHVQGTRFVFSLSTYSYKLCYRVSRTESIEQLFFIYIYVHEFIIYLNEMSVKEFVTANWEGVY